MYSMTYIHRQCCKDKVFLV